MNISIREELYFSAHRLIGSDLGRVCNEYRKSDASGVSSKLVKQSLINILDHCAHHVPYYADMMAKDNRSYQQDPIRYLEQFPILSKDLIRQHSESLTSKDLSSRRWKYNTSGGSTGEPIRFIQDRGFWDCHGAAEIVSHHWAGREFGELAMFVWGSERDILQGSMAPQMRILNRIANVRYLNAYRMTPVRMKEFIEQINTSRPKLIVAYADSIYGLAQFAEKESLTIVPQSAILTSAGTLHPYKRDKIEAVFKCKVFNDYGSREVGGIACECHEHNGLHVFPWNNYIEVVDGDGHKVPEGVIGDILVTNMTNYAMPLIRYAIGDRGALAPSEECACGRTGQRLDQVLGHTADAFKTKDGTLIDGSYFESILYFRDWITKFQVTQKSYSLVVFQIVSPLPHPRNDEFDEITQKVRAVLGPDCQVRFEFVADIPPSASGKYRYTISEIG